MHCIIGRTLRLLIRQKAFYSGRVSCYVNSTVIHRGLHKGTPLANKYAGKVRSLLLRKIKAGTLTIMDPKNQEILAPLQASVKEQVKTVYTFLSL